MNPFIKTVAKCNAVLARMDRAETKARAVLARIAKAEADWNACYPELAARINRR
jgi:hypothetical protein